jgi:hypothetical protein
MYALTFTNLGKFTIGASLLDDTAMMSRSALKGRRDPKREASDNRAVFHQVRQRNCRIHKEGAGHLTIKNDRKANEKILADPLSKEKDAVISW